MNRYNSLNSYLKNQYGCKVYKLSLSSGLSCPNRDGSLSDMGCIFCSNGGSGEFATSCNYSITEQIEMAKERVSTKIKNGKYIAYFQSFTNTYGNVDYLEKIFTEAINHPDIVCLSIGTRPDCLPDDVIDLLNRLNKIKPVWIELGLQTIHEDTASYIRRGYDLPVFEHALKRLRQLGIPVIVHTILGLPGEDIKRNLETMHYLNDHHIQGIKLQLLHVLKYTDLADDYLTGRFSVYSMEEYFEVLSSCICNLNPDIVIHRLTGDGPKDLLIAPTWSTNKRHVLNQMQSWFKIHDIWQGKEL